MIVVVGGLASGKRTYIEGLGYVTQDMADGVLDERPVLLNLQDFVAKDSREPHELASALSGKKVVSCCEIGNGIVPIDPDEITWRERVGRTLNLLSADAERVVRMVCGIPVVLKDDE